MKKSLRLKENYTKKLIIIIKMKKKKMYLLCYNSKAKQTK